MARHPALIDTPDAAGKPCVLGVNAGRLGVLAEFDVDSLPAHAAEVFGPDPLIEASSSR